MKIRICEENIGKIQGILDTIQSKCRERTITANDIVCSVNDIEEEFKISNKAMIGVKVHADQHAQSYPNAYKYVPYSTQYDMERTSSGWFLVNADRMVTGKSKKVYHVTLTDAAKAALINRFTQF